MTSTSLDFGSSHARRLPIYILVECSESMGKEPLKLINQGIQQLITDLNANPVAVETAWLSLITFSTDARQIIPLTEITKFTLPSLSIGSDASLGAAFDLLAQCIYHEIRRNTPAQKGDWKPIVFLLVSGKPTDDWQGALVRFQSYISVVNLIAIGCGEDVDTKMLTTITPNVLLMENMKSGDLFNFFQWISASVQTASVSVASEGQINSLPITPPVDAFDWSSRKGKRDCSSLSFPTVVETQPAENLKFYEKLRKSITKWVKSQGLYGNYVELILFAPDLFMLLSRLVMDERVQPQLKTQLLLVLAYFISPIDPIPEAIVGPIGYIDDIVLTSLAILRLVGETREDIIREHWAGQGDIVALLNKITSLGSTLVGSQLWISMKKKLGFDEKDS